MNSGKQQYSRLVHPRTRIAPKRGLVWPPNSIEDSLPGDTKTCASRLDHLVLRGKMPLLCRMIRSHIYVATATSLECRIRISLGRGARGMVTVSDFRRINCLGSQSEPYRFRKEHTARNRVRPSRCWGPPERPIGASTRFMAEQGPAKNQPEP